MNSYYSRSEADYDAEVKEARLKHFVQLLLPDDTTFGNARLLWQL